jgi:hemerythrin-like domain-containing protein
MKRHPFLLQLSREHHQGLVLARKARRWAAGDATEGEQGWAAVRHAYESELRPHFEEEEARVFPLLAAHAEKLVARALDDHRRLRTLALGGSTLAELEELGQLLEAHIRFEERELFPAVEHTLEDGP